MKKKLNNTKINRKKIAWTLGLCLLAPFSIYFIASCGNDSQLNSGDSTTTPPAPLPPLTPPDKPNPPSSVLITKDQITFENAYKSPPSLYIDQTNNQLLLNDPLLIKTTYSKTDFTKITTTKLAFDDAIGSLAFELTYESKGVPVISSFTYTNFQPILKERKVSVQYWKDDFINSKLNAYDYANKTYSTPEQVNAFIKILNDNNKGSIFVNYDLLNSSYELNPQNYSIKTITTGAPKYEKSSSNLNLTSTYSIDIITLSKTESGNIIKNVFAPSSVSDTTFSVSFPSLPQYVLNNLVENGASDPSVIKIKAQYPSYYYSSFAQPLLGIGSDPLGFIPEAYLINTVIENEGLFKYTTRLTVDGKEEQFSITCSDVSDANDITGQLSLSIYITQENPALGNPNSSHKTFQLAGFKELTSVNDLFLQTGETNKIDKFSINTSTDTNISNVLGGIVKSQDAKLKVFIDASPDNEVVISPAELDKIVPSLKTFFNNNTYIYFGADRSPLVKKVPTVEQGTDAFYTYSPFYTNIVAKDFTKLVYNKTTTKYTIYFDMTVGISSFNTYNHEFSFELNIK